MHSCGEAEDLLLGGDLVCGPLHDDLAALHLAAAQSDAVCQQVELEKVEQPAGLIRQGTEAVFQLQPHLVYLFGCFGGAESAVDVEALFVVVDVAAGEVDVDLGFESGGLFGADFFFQ